MPEILELQADEWESEVMSVDGPIVVDFWHHMCGWCQKLDPIFAQLPDRFEKVKFAKMNVLDSAENRQIAMDAGVLGTPTIKVFCDGRSIGEVVGFRPLDRLVKELGEILASKDDCLEHSTPLE